MPKEEVKIIKELAKLTQNELKKVLFKMLRSKYQKVVCHKKYLYAEGDIPIVLLAHMDTVFPHPPQNIFYDQEKTTLWSSEGLGADDRAGVYAICKILRDGYKPHVIFTTDEEIGCIGSTFLSKKKCPFKDVRYAIQLDRRGAIDCVFYECANEEFVDYVEKFGFKEEFGSFTDIAVLCPEWGFAGVNLSVGYFNEHNAIETLNTTYLQNTIEKVEKMLSEKDIPSFEYIEDTSTRWWYNYCMKDPNLRPYACCNYGYDDTYYGDTGLEQCDSCLNYYIPEDLIPVYDYRTDTTYQICIDCLSESNDIRFCAHCNEAFMGSNDPHEKYCKKCKEEIKVTV